MQKSAEQATEYEIASGSTRHAGDVRRFPCKQCGAQLEFAPGQEALECPYCGYREEIPRTEQAIREYDLGSALENLPHSEGWGTERRAVHCTNCGATTSFEPGQVAGACAFCGSSKVVEQPSSTNLIRPETLIPFAVTHQQASIAFSAWIRQGWFRPNDLKHAARLGRIQGAYLPFWTFDAFASSHWTAEAGYYYYETESYLDRDEQGNMVTRTRQVQRIRWEPAAGYREDFFDDELVCASAGLPPALVQNVLPFDLDGLTGYSPAFLAGFAAEEYQIDLQAGWVTAHERMEQAVYQRCAGDIPGDTHRNLHVNSAWSQRTFKHLLLPIWVAAYLYRDRTYRFLVNGQTGKAAGDAPVSWWKVALAILLLLLAALLIAYLSKGRYEIGFAAPGQLTGLLAALLPLR